MWTTSSSSNALTPTIVALGNFDGIHRGHVCVVQPVLSLTDWHLGYPEQASKTLAENPSRSTQVQFPKRKYYSSVITFTPHPQEFFSGQPKTLLTPLSEKIDRLKTLGIEQLIRLPFNQELAELSPAKFIETILIEQFKVQGISVGQDFCFGRDRSGTAEHLRQIAARYHIPVKIIPLQVLDHDRISSSAIRQALTEGNIPQANRLLGYHYCLEGTVVTGQKLGRTIGFPTANLKLPPEKFLPRQGVYSVWVTSPTRVSLRNPHPGVMNLGTRPTVSGQIQTIEIYLLNWSGDLYGNSLKIELAQFIRPEQKFASIEQLKAQIKQDCETAQQQLDSRILS